ncbi:MAG: aminoacyl-tRNA hydrolase [Cyclobacteriaceae bacterium]|jgi:PTH1 family peptidyl-tRNA hydrolase|nr:aminoacyl-tRNA hydrolase [Cyclobacteriaceae bacterium]
MTKFLIVGLGNPGPEYECTRHNIGFLVLDRLADVQKAGFATQRLAEKALFKHKGKAIHLIKPNTYMNLSGKAMAFWMNDLGVAKEHTLVVVDDLALPFGALRLKPRGSAAGHNGLKNIEELTGGQDYPRLRFGIGSDFGKGQQVDYVLSPFTPLEFDHLTPRIDRACDMILSFCTAGIAQTMNQFNQ